jgi:hypothetical protein
LTKSIFLKNVGKRKKVDYKNVGLKKSATTNDWICRRKNVVTFLKNVGMF